VRVIIGISLSDYFEQAATLDNFLCMMKHLTLLWSSCSAIALMLGVSSLVPSSRVHALQFHFEYPEETPSEVINGFERAAGLWSSVLSDDITVDVAIDFQPFNSTSLGRFSPETTTIEYRDILDALRHDISSISDTTAFHSLPNSHAVDQIQSEVDFDLLINRTLNNPNGVGSPTPYIDANGNCNNRSVRITTANAKALGLPTVGTSQCLSNRSVPSKDGSIIINSNFDWDFDVSDGFEPLTYDFVGVAMQGLGATLGNISGIRLLELNGPLIEGGESYFFEDRLFPFVSLPDLYRFSEESAASGVIDWTTGRTDASGAEVPKYFSIDGGHTPLAHVSTGLIYGDGNRPSSWQADEIGGMALGLFEPTPNAEQVLQFSPSDQILFDAIGYNIASSTGSLPVRGIDADTDQPESIPEPSSAIALLPVAWFGMKWLRKPRQ
jgi:hypothetical protein